MNGTGPGMSIGRTHLAMWLCPLANLFNSIEVSHMRGLTCKQIQWRKEF